jgi:hypothetical protein
MDEADGGWGARKDGGERWAGLHQAHAKWTAGAGLPDVCLSACMLNDVPRGEDKAPDLDAACVPRSEGMLAPAPRVADGGRHAGKDEL